jgi:hypothetical protein
MSKFTISVENCTTGFSEHVTLDLLRPVEDQLNREIIIPHSGPETYNTSYLKHIIDRNASLRISFGWSFESGHQYEQMMDECLKELLPRYTVFPETLVSDMRASWLGFMSFDIFERLIYEDLDVNGLIAFNNELIDFQTEVVRFISKHKCFLQHSFLRNSNYRFHYMKSMRNDPAMLSDAFQYYVDAIEDTIGMLYVSRQHLEENIGCHYLNYPDIFFELLGFYKLKGVIYD